MLGPDYWDPAERAAYDVGLLPWEFDQLTPRDLERVVEARGHQEEREWYRVAWLACYILAPWSKRKVTPEKLLGKKPKPSAARVRKIVGQPIEVPPSGSSPISS